MRYLFLALLFIAADVWSGQTCDFGRVSDEAPAQTQQFSFLIGRHDVALHAWTGDGWTPPRKVAAQWRGEYGLDGLAIYDEWIDPNPQRPSKGVNVRVYDADSKIWKMMWISTGTLQVQDLRAQVQEGKLTMWQVYPPRPGWKAVFEILDQHSWQRIDYQQNEGQQWQPQFRLVATRRACERRTSSPGG